MLSHDSIYIEPFVGPSLSPPATPRQLTPYQVLKNLPKDATPAQQDSAIQAWFQPGEIHYSEQPDTLHLPGYGKGKSFKDVSLPQYYRESYFSSDTLYHPELDGGRFGVAGDPVPYTVYNDNVVGSVLLVCFVMSLTAFSACRHLLVEMVKNFFKKYKTTQMSLSETYNEVRAQAGMMVQTSIMLALLYFFYVRYYVSSTFVLSDEYLLAGIYTLAVILYFCITYAVNFVVNAVFFDNKRNIQYFFVHLFIDSFQGVLLFPPVMWLAFFNPDPKSVIVYVTFAIATVKLLTLYKCYDIFFRQNDVYLQIILYFCTLEITPLLALWSVLEVITNGLKIIF